MTYYAPKFTWRESQTKWTIDQFTELNTVSKASTFYKNAKVSAQTDTLIL